MATIADTILDQQGDPVETQIRFAGAGAVTAPDGQLSKSIIVASSDSDGTLEVEIREGDYVVTWANGSAVSRRMIRVPAGSGTYSLDELGTAYDARTKTQIIAWTESESFILSDQSAILESTPVTWPDGTPGLWTCTEVNEGFGVPDAFALTYARGGTTLTVTQPTVTRDSEGTVTYRPTPTIA